MLTLHKTPDKHILNFFFNLQSGAGQDKILNFFYIKKCLTQTIFLWYMISNICYQLMCLICFMRI